MLVFVGVSRPSHTLSTLPAHRSDHTPWWTPVPSLFAAFTVAWGFTSGNLGEFGRLRMPVLGV